MFNRCKVFFAKELVSTVFDLSLTLGNTEMSLTQLKAARDPTTAGRTAGGRPQGCGWEDQDRGAAWATDLSKELGLTGPPQPFVFTVRPGV